VIKKKGGGWEDSTIPAPHQDAKNLVQEQNPEKQLEKQVGAK